MSFFPCLPAELQLKIWEFASMSPGVHKFKLHQLRDGAIQLIPLADGDADPSAWRERMKLRRINKLASDGLHPVTRASQRTVYQDTSIRRHTRTEEIDVVAKVDGKTDLVFLQIHGDRFYMQKLAQRGAKAGCFANLTRIAFSFQVRKPEHDRILRPFGCLCLARDHKNHQYCAPALAEFLRLLKDLEKFYFVLNLTGREIAKSFSARQGTTATGRRVKQDMRPAAVRIPEVVEELRGNVKRHGLETFQDRKGMYYEVRKEDTMHMLNKHDQIWNLLSLLRRKYHGNADKFSSLPNPGRQRRLNTKFKVLVFVETKYTLVPEHDDA